MSDTFGDHVLAGKNPAGWKPSRNRTPEPARLCPDPAPGHVHNDACYATQAEWDRDIEAGYQGRHVADPDGWVFELRKLAALLASLGVVLGVALHTAGAQAAAAPGVVTVSGLDLHDGSLLQSGSTWYLYGTRYGCGFVYGVTSPWCGYGYATAASPAGPWTYRGLLFSPGSKIEAAGWTKDNGRTWSAMCGQGGAGSGCFNARMVRTPAGAWLLWFNAPSDKSRGANPYWNMSCSGPAGPCPAPHKPAIYTGCRAGGDFSIAQAGGQGWIVCSGPGHDETLQPLAAGMRDGQNRTVTVAGMVGEGEGITHTSAGYELIDGSPCGYCSGTTAATPGAVASTPAYATAPALGGPWTYHGALPGGTCAGQTRTAGAGWELIDRWTGSRSETAAAVALVPIATWASCK